jgi:cytosine/adenosine deaminase-related metal-dependent hydrolase
MRSSHSGGLTFINARSSGGDIITLRIAGSHIAAVGQHPLPDDRVVDLQGDRLLPGFINAHDHLSLNSLSRHGSHTLQGSPTRYGHAREWMSDIVARRRSDPQFAADVAVRRDARLLIGGIKNLLSGVTTAAHHDPLYTYLSSPDYPIGVVQHYGWSHSLYVEGEESVADSYRRTPRTWPWIMHAAEGLNHEAANEFERLDALGCLGANTVLVHGIALDQEQRMRLTRAAAGLIWCPSSNLNLFGRTAEVSDLVRHRRVALGTDSRLSGARDLLEELHAAGEVCELDDRAMERLVTRDSARLLRLADRGALCAGMRADLVILPARARLAALRRSDVRLVLIGGGVRYGDRDIACLVEPASQWADVHVDGAAKILDGRIAAALAVCTAEEPGLVIRSAAWRAA